MSEQENNPFNIKVSYPAEDQKQSPRFGTIKKQQEFQAIQNVGKHGKSHHTYMKVMNQHKPVSQMRNITLEQLATHTTAQSAWLSLNGVIYDVTVYLHFHPGGQILLKGCGQQCDALFNKYHHWVNAKHLLQKYAIGHLSYH